MGSDQANAEWDMFSIEELWKLRFGMSDLPKPGGSPGDYEEKLSQWFLERCSFVIPYTRIICSKP